MKTHCNLMFDLCADSGSKASLLVWTTNPLVEKLELISFWRICRGKSCDFSSYTRANMPWKRRKLARVDHAQGLFQITRVARNRGELFSKVGCTSTSKKWAMHLDFHLKCQLAVLTSLGVSILREDAYRTGSGHVCSIPSRNHQRKSFPFQPVCSKAGWV